MHTTVKSAAGHSLSLMNKNILKICGMLVLLLDEGEGPEPLARAPGCPRGLIGQALALSSPGAVDYGGHDRYLLPFRIRFLEPDLGR